MTAKELLLGMKIGEQKEIVFSNGILKSTKDLFRSELNEWEVDSHNCGWVTARLDLETASGYLEGKIKGYELDWD